jgi:phage-related protein
MEDQQEQAALALTLQNVTGAGAAQTAQIEDQISAMSRASGIADTEYRKSLEALVRGTKDVDLAMKDMNLVMDISTALQMDSSTVADALAKAYQGNFKALRSLTPEMATMIKEGASLNEVMDVLGGTFGGATATAADTAAGKMKILSNSIGETKESIGAALLPVVEAVLPILNKFAMWAQDNPQAFLAIAGAIGAVAAAIVATNIAMALNPFSLIAAGIALLVVALVTAYNKFEWFRNGINTIVNTVIGFFAGMVNAAIGAVNAIISAYNSIPLLPDIPKAPTVPVPQLGKTSNTPAPGRMSIPRLAEGGIVSSPTLALIGEAGPEAVVPLDRMQTGGGITINVTGGLATSAEIGESVVNALRAYSRSAGPLQLQVA